MRKFDSRLLEILKQEPELERRVRTDAAYREALYQDLSVASPKEHKEEPRPVTISRKLRYMETPAHKARHCEMFYIASGHATAVVNGKEITLKEGDIFVRNCYSVCSLRELGEDDIVICFLMKNQFLEDVCTRLKSNTVLTEFMLDTIRDSISWNRYLHFTDIEDISVLNLVETMIYAAYPYMNDETLPHGIDPESTITEYMMTALFSSLARGLNSISDKSVVNYEEVIREHVCNYIATEYRTASLKELAKIMNLSESTLSRQIKNIFGYTFKELLLQKRFERAEMLLMSTDLSTFDIVEAVGYENTSFFYRRFREIHGVSPKDYRKTHA